MADEKSLDKAVESSKDKQEGSTGGSVSSLVPSTADPKIVAVFEQRRRNLAQAKEKSGGGGGEEGHKRGSTSSGRDRNRKSSTSAGQQTSAGAGGGGGGDTSSAFVSGGGAGQQGKKNKPKYSVRKRVPPKKEVEIKPNDVFVNEKSHFVSQVSKCKKLFDKGHREVFLHGLGKAIPRALNIAVELKSFYHNTVDYTVNTSTVQVSDDLIPIDDPDQPPIVRTRNVSSVDIKIFRCVDIP